MLGVSRNFEISGIEGKPEKFEKSMQRKLFVNHSFVPLGVKERVVTNAAPFPGYFPADGSYVNVVCFVCI